MAAYVVPGPCIIQFTPKTGLIKTLGTTKEGVRIEIRTGLTPVTDDRHGKVPATGIFTGKSATVSFNLIDVETIKLADIYLINQGNIFNVGTAIYSGILASAIAGVLKITENWGIANNFWTADLAIPRQPGEIVLSSTREFILPLSFLILPSGTGKKLFSAIPTYV